MEILIIGAGMMGSAMAVPALEKGHRVTVAGTPLDAEIIDELKRSNYHKTLKRELRGDISFRQYEEVSENIPESDVVVSGVSSFGAGWFAEEVIPKLKSGQKVLAVTKGLHGKSDGTLETIPEWYTGLRPDIYFNAVGGPCISFELADRVQTEVAFCGRDKKVLEELRGIFGTEYYHISVTDDVKGIETAVALKNAYAMAVSLAIGAYAGNNPEQPGKYNAQAGLFYESVREIRELIKLLGGGENALAFGAGDLYVTVFGGRTRRLGVILGSGIEFSEAEEQLSGVTLESVAVIRLMGKYLGNRLAEYPLMANMYERITRNTVPDIPWNSFLHDYLIDG